MDNRRLELLLPVIFGPLSKAAFDNFHKTLSYEIGEIFVSLLETKLDKFRNRSTVSSKTHSREVDERQLKRVEMKRCNEYCIGAIRLFAHFTGHTINTATDSVLIQPLTQC